MVESYLRSRRSQAASWPCSWPWRPPSMWQSCVHGRAMHARYMHMHVYTLERYAQMRENGP